MDIEVHLSSDVLSGALCSFDLQSLLPILLTVPTYLSAYNVFVIDSCLTESYTQVSSKRDPVY